MAENKVEVYELTGVEVEQFVEKALSDQSVVKLIEHSINYFSKQKSNNYKELISKALGGKFDRDNMHVEVLTLVLDDLNTVISYAIEGVSVRAISNIYEGDIINTFQAVGDKVYSIVTINTKDENLEYEWHENPLFDYKTMKNEVAPKSSEGGASIQVSSCTVCQNVCNAIQGMGCGLAGTAACMIACAPIGSVACPFICAALWGLKCWGDNILLCGPSCKSLGFC